VEIEPAGGRAASAAGRSQMSDAPGGAGLGSSGRTHSGAAGGSEPPRAGASGSPGVPCDADGDGYDAPACGGADCDDSDSSVHPGAWDTNAVAGDWWAEFVFGDIPGDTRGKTSIAVDRDGSLHVSEASEGLRYASNGGATRSYQMLDPLGRGAPSLALTPSGEPVIAYLVEDAVWIALHENGRWSLLPASGLEPANTARNGGGVELEIDANGRSHLVYVDANEAVRYARGADSAFRLEPRLGTSSALVPALALDPSGAPHLAFGIGDGNGRLVYATRCSSGFCQSDVATGPMKDVDIAIDITGGVHVLHAGSLLDAPIVHDILARDGSWSHQSFGADSVDAFSLAIAASSVKTESTLHVAWDGNAYARFEQNVWVRERTPWGGVGLSLAIEGAAVVHIGRTDFRFDVNTFVEHVTNRSVIKDGVDSNCDGVDGVDRDADGEASIQSGGTDCNDHDPSISSRLGSCSR